MLERLPGIFEFTLQERENSPHTIQVYIVRGSEEQRSLLIDTGYGTAWSLQALENALRELQVDPSSLDVFLTHKHADHCGLAHELQTRGAHLFMNDEEDRHKYSCLYYKLDHSNENAQQRVLTRTGITQETAPLIWEKFMDFNQRLSDEHPVWMMTIEEYDYTDVKPGMFFDYGSYHFEVIGLRGHTYGQLGLIEREKKLIFSADQILNKTTPIVGSSHADEQLLLNYLTSIRELADTYSDYFFLPAHEGPIENLKEAVSRTLSAYERKISQCLLLVGEKEQTVWQIAKQLYGLTPDKRSDAAFYNAKMINTKTFSMLEYLYDAGLISRREENGMLFWSKASL